MRVKKKLANKESNVYQKVLVRIQKYDVDKLKERNNIT